MFGDMMDGGLEMADTANDLLAMEEELNANENEDGGKDETFEITLSICFDEDDKNTNNIDLMQLFQADAGLKCYQTKVSQTLLS